MKATSQNTHKKAHRSQSHTRLPTFPPSTPPPSIQEPGYLQYDFIWDLVKLSKFTKNLAIYDLHSFCIWFMIFQGLRLSFWCVIQLKNTQLDLKFPSSSAHVSVAIVTVVNGTVNYRIPNAKVIPATVMALIVYWVGSELSQQYSTNENPSLSRNYFLANLMHGHSDSSWSGSSLPEITEQRIFYILFYCEQIRLKCIINCIYPSWLNF